FLAGLSTPRHRPGKAEDASNCDLAGHDPRGPAARRASERGSERLDALDRVGGRAGAPSAPAELGRIRSARTAPRGGGAAADRGRLGAPAHTGSGRARARSWAVSGTDAAEAARDGNGRGRGDPDREDRLRVAAAVLRRGVSIRAG